MMYVPYVVIKRVKSGHLDWFLIAYLNVIVINWYANTQKAENKECYF